MFEGIKVLNQLEIQYNLTLIQAIKIVGAFKFLEKDWKHCKTNRTFFKKETVINAVYISAKRFLTPSLMSIGNLACFDDFNDKLLLFKF